MARRAALWLPGLVLAAAAQAAPPPDPERLENLLQQDCGSCHGLTLRGGLGPALTPEALAGRPRQVLARTILDGRPGTPMPPWRGLLTEAEADWLAGRLLEGEGAREDR